jgi:transcriptional regulator with XRE-family HTH domain
MVQRQAKARRADLRDAEVGRRVRARRLERGITQTELATRIGVTFQQVQKYEKGVNRIGAGRLQRIAEALEVPVTFFFGGNETPVTAASGDDASVFGYLQTSGAIRIVKAFYRIKDRRTRQLLVELAERISGGKE